MTTKATTTTTWPSDLVDEMKELHQRVQMRSSGERLWQCISAQERCHLGNEFEKAYRQGGTLGFWKQLHGVGTTHAIIDLAAELEFISPILQRKLLRATGEHSDDTDEALEMALQRADFVLTERPRAAYWKKTAIGIDWDRYDTEWVYLSTFMRCAKAGRAPGSDDFSEFVKPDNHIKTKSRMTRRPEFPEELAVAMDSVGTASQQQYFPRHKIRIIEVPT